MAANSALTVTGLTFTEIRSKLRNFLSVQTELKDFDWNSSAIGVLLDLLAYNTYLNAFYANMSTNEAFLDTAQRYDSVVSRAKALGYRPISAKGAVANVKIIFSTAANSTVRTLTVAAGTKFTSQINGTSYTFVTPTSQTILANSTNGFLGYLKLQEGEPLIHRWTYSTANTSFTIPNANTDISSIAIAVTTNGNTVNYIEATDIFTVNSSSRVFYIEADQKSKYLIRFGDGVLGERPVVGSTVAVAYRVCNAAKPNGANTFTAVSTVAGQSSFTLTTMERADSGTEQEPINSIRFNAPRAYESQNRAVTTNDYVRRLLQLNPDLAAVSVWGGEDNVPAIYGKVYIAVKPTTGSTVSEARKTILKNQLKRYNVQTIGIEFVDATYLYLQPNVTIHYDPNRTTLLASDIATAAGKKIAIYESTVLNRFGGKFKGSRFLEQVDLANQAITGSAMDLWLQKLFVPSLLQKTSYTIKFNHPLNHPGPGFLYAIASSSFTYLDKKAYFDDDGYGNVRIYYIGSTGTRTYLTTTAGTVDYDLGTIVLSDFLPTAFSGSELAIHALPAPAHFSVMPVRNQIILLRNARVSVVNEISGVYEIINQYVSVLGDTTTVLSPSYSTTITI